MRRLGLVLSLLLFAACPGPNPARDAGELARSLVRVEVSYTRAAGAAEVRFDAQGHFVRYRSFDPAGVPAILGFADYENIPLDSCRSSDATAGLDAALDGTTAGGLIPAEVALLDAGHLELRGPPGSNDRSQIHARRYPDLVPFVSGVVYGGDDTAPVALALGQPFQVVGEGGDEVGPFTSTVTAPRAFPELKVEPLRRGADLDVRWNAADSNEPILLEVKWASRSGSRAVRCRVHDGGEFSIPAAAFDALPAQAAATVSATRVARAPIDAPGAGRGELSLALRDVAPLQVQQ